MKSYFRYYLKLIIIAVAMIVLLGYATINSIISRENNNNDSYISAIEHNSDYNIYFNGEKKDNSNFKISSLDKDKYSFEVDNENKDINININISPYQWFFHPNIW